jgi:hypothetical protein
MSGLRQDVNDAVKAPPVTEATHEHDGPPPDPTTIKFNGPVQLSDEDVGSDPYNRTGRFRRLVR